MWHWLSVAALRGVACCGRGDRGGRSRRLAAPQRTDSVHRRRGALGHLRHRRHREGHQRCPPPRAVGEYVSAGVCSSARNGGGVSTACRTRDGVSLCIGQPVAARAEPVRVFLHGRPPGWIDALEALSAERLDTARAVPFPQAVEAAGDRADPRRLSRPPVRPGG